MAKLNGAASAKLASSGLTVAQGERLGMIELTAAQVAKLKGIDPSWQGLSALQLTYHDFDGLPTGFIRLRALEDDRAIGFAQDAFKAKRYTQPTGEVTEAYLPTLLPKGDTWRAIAKDPARCVIVTEGELKAAAAMAKGLPPCIGLGGASNYKSTKRNLPLLPMLEAFEWLDRETFIVLDSDAAQNPRVELAQYKLAEELAQRGARVLIGVLPPGKDGAKQGVDDYLLLHTARTFEEQILDVAQPVAECEALHSFNDRFVAVTNPGMVVNLVTGQEMASDKFVRFIHANETYTVPVIKVVDKTRKITGLKTKRTAQEWVDWRARRIVNGMAYEPGAPRITAENRFNTWPGWGCAPIKGDVSPWTRLMDHTFHAEGAWWRKWAEQWYACPFQNPGIKMHAALVLYSPGKGTGKSLLGESMMPLYGASNWGKVKEKNLSADFNEWAANKQFIMGEEISSGDTRKTSIGEILKDLITQKTVTINKKYIPTYTVKDHINYQFNTNHPDAFYLDDGERRMAVNATTAPNLPFEFFKKTYIPWINSKEGASALHWHLLHLDMKGFDPHDHVPDTKAKRDMESTMRSDLSSWVRQLRDAPNEILGNYLFDIASASTLLSLYLGSSNKNTRLGQMHAELQRQKVLAVNNGATIRTPSGSRQALYIIRDAERWRQVREAVATAHLSGRAPLRKQRGAK